MENDPEHLDNDVRFHPLLTFSFNINYSINCITLLFSGLDEACLLTALLVNAASFRFHSNMHE